MSDTVEQLQNIISIMAKLRDPDTGCPWDLKQDFATIAPYTIEEAYEVVDAIERGDRAAICDELGDLLLQVVFHARIAEEEGCFTLADVIRSISDKMGLTVVIKNTKKNSGTITLTYKEIDQLNKIIEILKSNY